MNRRTTRTLILALIAAALASYAVHKAGARGSAINVPTAFPIVVAARDLEVGTIVKDSDLKRARWIGPPPKGAAVEAASVTGRGVVSALYEGEPVLENRLAPPGAGGGLAATIPAGMRACAVKVDEVVGVAGFAVSGMRVDVLALAVRNRESGTRVKTVLQNIEVLSAGTNYQRDIEGKPEKVQVINLLVTPDQAEILSLASNERIQLVLRNPLDRQTAQTTGRALAGLFEDPPRAVPGIRPRPVRHAAAAPAQTLQSPPYVVEIWNASKRTEVKLSSAKGQQP